MKAPPCQFNEIVGKIKMLSMEVRTSLSMEELADRLKEFFGKGALGLALKEDCPGRMTFEGGGGHVTATFCAESGKNPPEDRDERMGRTGEEVHRRTTMTLRARFRQGRRKKGSGNSPRSCFDLLIAFDSCFSPAPNTLHPAPWSFRPARPQPGALAPFRPGAPMRISRRRPGR